jgi:hypothetical protein
MQYSYWCQKKLLTSHIKEANDVTFHVRRESYVVLTKYEFSWIWLYIPETKRKNIISKTETISVVEILTLL